MRPEEKKALKILGDNVRRERLRVKLSQERLGYRCRLDRTYISGIERGHRNCTILKVCMIATALGVDSATLLAGVKTLTA
jgi:transcriptional regulator with XRE-family HTH domain